MSEAVISIYSPYFRLTVYTESRYAPVKGMEYTKRGNTESTLTSEEVRLKNRCA
ncbi:Uncharacterised protein [Segatella copri]|nr:Uncharacterised protein [Segatella copri]